MASQLLTKCVGLIDEPVKFSVFGETHGVINDSLGVTVVFLREPVDFKVLEMDDTFIVDIGKNADFIDEGI